MRRDDSSLRDLITGGSELRRAGRSAVAHRHDTENAIASTSAGRLLRQFTLHGGDSRDSGGRGWRRRQFAGIGRDGGEGSHLHAGFDADGFHGDRLDRLGRTERRGVG